MAKRYYWLRLKDGFFSSDDIRIIQVQENGPEYIIFWLKLLLRSISQDEPGRLRYKDNIPYDDKILATVTDTDIDVVRSAMKLFAELEMIRIDDAGTIWIDEARELVGSEGGSAPRVRTHRKRRKALQCNTDVTKSNDCNVQSNREKRRDREDLREEKRKEGEAEKDPFPLNDEDEETEEEF